MIFFWRTNSYQSRRAPKARGFTLLEMLVSLALFSTVMVIVGTAYLNLINLDRQTRATNDVVNNLSFSVDSMARAIRTGTTYACSPGDSNGNGTCSTFSFYDSTGCFQTYTLQSGNIMSTITDPKSTGKCSVGSNVPLTAAPVSISNLTFYVRGVGAGDQRQPQVTFIIHGAVNIDTTHPAVNFTIQTGATQRNIEL